MFVWFLLFLFMWWFWFYGCHKTACVLAAVLSFVCFSTPDGVCRQLFSPLPALILPILRVKVCTDRKKHTRKKWITNKSGNAS
jgi:hypothetical protein